MILMLNINQLLFANMHIGHTLKFFNDKLKGILIGLRKNLCILNINHSIWQFKLVGNLIINTISKRHKLLIVRDCTYLKLQSYFSLNNVIFYEKKWIGGSLTNFKSVRVSSRFKNISLKELYQNRRIPSIIFFFDINKSKWALLEGYNLGIVTVSLIDTDSNFSEQVVYPIIGNNKNIDSILLYLFFLRNSVIRGYKTEIVRVLYIRDLMLKNRDQNLIRLNIENVINSWFEKRKLSRKFKFFYFRFINSRLGKEFCKKLIRRENNINIFEKKLDIKKKKKLKFNK